MQIFTAIHSSANKPCQRQQFVGIGLAFGLSDMAFQALALLFINLVCLDFITSIPVLYVVGVRLEHLGIEKKIRDATEKTVNDIAETSK